MSISTSKYFDRVCRLCLVESNTIVGLFPPEVPAPRWTLIRMIRESLNITITLEDVLPKKLCRDCIVNVTQFHAFLFRAKEKQKQLMTMCNIMEPKGDQGVIQPQKTNLVPDQQYDTSDEEAVDSPDPINRLKKGTQSLEVQELPQSKRLKLHPGTRAHDEHETPESGAAGVIETHFVSVNSIKDDSEDPTSESPNLQIKVETKDDNSASSDILSAKESDVSVVEVKQEDNIDKDNETKGAESEEKLVVRQLNDEAWMQLHKIIKGHPKVKSSDFLPLYKFLFGQPYVVKWKCEFCHLFIEAPTKNYDTHMIDVHEITPRYPCEMCGKYLGLEEYIPHWTEHHLEYQCPACWRRFTNSRDLRTHHDNVHSRRQYTVLCDTCGVRFLEEEHLRKHLETHKIENITTSVPGKSLAPRKLTACKACKKTFISELRYFYHRRKCKALKEMNEAEIQEMLNLSNDSDVNNYRFFYCDECEEQIPNENELKAHRKKHAVQENLAREMPSSASPVLEEKDEDKSETPEDLLLLCDICAYEAQSLSDLQTHITTHANQHK